MLLAVWPVLRWECCVCKSAGKSCISSVLTRLRDSQWSDVIFDPPLTCLARCLSLAFAELISNSHGRHSNISPGQTETKTAPRRSHQVRNCASRGSQTQGWEGWQHSSEDQGVSLHHPDEVQETLHQLHHLLQVGGRGEVPYPGHGESSLRQPGGGRSVWDLLQVLCDPG